MNTVEESDTNGSYSSVFTDSETTIRSIGKSLCIPELRHGIG